LSELISLELPAEEDLRLRTIAHDRARASRSVLLSNSGVRNDFTVRGSSKSKSSPCIGDARSMFMRPILAEAARTKQKH
jgi:hypothetical protein